MTKTEKMQLIEDMRKDPEVIRQIRRSLEARQRGDVVHWNDVKVELGIE